MSVIEKEVVVAPDPLEAIPVRPEIPNRDKVLEILKRGRALLARPHGWIRENYKSHDRRADGEYGYCTLGALGWDDGWLDTTSGADSRTRAALMIVETLGLNDPDEIPIWNDGLPARGGKKEVLDVFDRTITRVEEG